ncbi:MAG: T9SS type A sorting domain-containing protein [Legionellales bacterium]
MNQRALNTIGANAARSIWYIEHNSNLDSCYAVPQTVAPDWDVFPSPFSNELLLQIRNCDCANVELKITDMLGKTVYKTTSDSYGVMPLKLLMNTQSLPAGIYIVRATLNRQWTLTKKIVKD